MNTQLIDFYLQSGTDHKSRTFDDILLFSNEDLEKNHDYIQWLFPLKEPSIFNPNAPLLDDETIEEFKTNNKLRNNVIIAWLKMMSFYLETNWISNNNHNYLRITRILTFLSLCDLSKQMACMLSFVLNQHIKNANLISIETVNYWIKGASAGL